MPDYFDQELADHLDPVEECPNCGDNSSNRFKPYCSKWCKDGEPED